MAKYEYKRVCLVVGDTPRRLPNDAEILKARSTWETLNEYGEQGWRVVSSKPLDKMMTIYLLERVVSADRYLWHEHRHLKTADNE